MSALSIRRPLRALAEVPDGVLVDEHLHGCDEAFTILYARYHDRLVRYLDRRTNDSVLAKDLAHEAMVRVLTYADSFDQGLPLWPWLKTIARRVAINHVQDEPEGDESLEDQYTSSEEQYEGEAQLDPLMVRLEDRSALEPVLRQLCARHQVALSLRYLRDWTPDQVSDFFGLSTNACNQLMFRARNAARREFERSSN